MLSLALSLHLVAPPSTTGEPSETRAPYEHASPGLQGHLGPLLWWCQRGLCLEDDIPLGWGFFADASYRIRPALALGGKLTYVFIPEHTNDEIRDYKVRHGLTLAPMVALHLPVSRWVDPYLDLGVGFHIDRHVEISSEYGGPEEQGDDRNNFTGMSLMAGVGLDVIIKDGFGLGPYVAAELPLLFRACNYENRRNRSCNPYGESGGPAIGEVGVLFAVQGRFRVSLR